MCIRDSSLSLSLSLSLFDLQAQERRLEFVQMVVCDNTAYRIESIISRVQVTPPVLGAALAVAVHSNNDHFSLSNFITSTRHVIHQIVTVIVWTTLWECSTDSSSSMLEMCRSDLRLGRWVGSGPLTLILGKETHPLEVIPTKNFTVLYCVSCSWSSYVAERAPKLWHFDKYFQTITHTHTPTVTHTHFRYNSESGICCTCTILFVEMAKEMYYG